MDRHEWVTARVLWWSGVSVQGEADRIIVTSLGVVIDRNSGGGAPPATNTPSSGKPLRLDYVDGVRAAAALYVVFHHVWLAIWPGYPRNEGPWWTDWLVYGHVAVAVFIVVSGFSLGLAPAANGSRLRGGAREFYRRRAWRILPAYWAALLFATCIVLLTGPGLGAEVSVPGTITHALLVQDIAGATTPNGAFWSIAIEAQIYLFFPLLIVLRRQMGLGATVLMGVVVATAAFILSVYVEPLHRIQSLVPQFAALFIMGMAGAELATRWHNTRRATPWARVAGIGTIGVVVWIAVVGSVVAVTYVFWLELVVGVIVALGLAALADGKSRRVRQILELRPAKWLGSISYSTYLIHAPLLLIVWTFVISDLAIGDVPRFFIFLALGLPLVLISSHFFSRWIEQPTQRHRSFRALWSALADSVRRMLGGSKAKDPFHGNSEVDPDLPATGTLGA
ncbi:acyltransferase [Microbacterium deminutum]|uniref:Acyltransferase 3 domain-containing protein n=1 Tax=Microbacterium deminutum TaxID=344164 RepID=A0ABP5C0Q5_9MICO